MTRSHSFYRLLCLVALCLVLIPGQALRTEATAVNWVRDAFAHLKIIGYVAAAQPLLDAASVMPDAGVLAVSDKSSLAMFCKPPRPAGFGSGNPACGVSADPRAIHPITNTNI